MPLRPLKSGYCGMLIQLALWLAYGIGGNTFGRGLHLRCVMAICRCRKCGPPKGLVKDHPHHHTIVAATELPVFCGRASCMNPPVVWLTEKEHQRYQAGQRVFTCGRRKGVVLA